MPSSSVSPLTRNYRLNTFKPQILDLTFGLVGVVSTEPSVRRGLSELAPRSRAYFAVRPLFTLQSLAVQMPESVFQYVCWVQDRDPVVKFWTLGLVLEASRMLIERFLGM